MVFLCDTGYGPRCRAYESRPCISSLRSREKSCKRVSIDAAVMIVAGVVVGLYNCRRYRTTDCSPRRPRRFAERGVHRFRKACRPTKRKPVCPSWEKG